MHFAGKDVFPVGVALLGVALQPPDDKGILFAVASGINFLLREAGFTGELAGSEFRNMVPPFKLLV